MKCGACGSDDVTKSKGKCHECLWIWEQEQANRKSSGPVAIFHRAFGIYWRRKDLDHLSNMLIKSLASGNLIKEEQKIASDMYDFIENLVKDK